MIKEAGIRRSTRQLLQKIPNFQWLYRHEVNGTYYAIKKVLGKRKEHSLDTIDRKIAERKLRDWIHNLDKVDSEVENTSLLGLLDKFSEVRRGKSESTRATERWLVNKLKSTWKHDIDIRISRIRVSMLEDWLAELEPKLKNSSYDRCTLFLKQLFDLAVNDRIISESPYYRLQRGWKRPEKPKRLVPTDEQFAAIVKNIREEKQNVDAEESADFIEFMGLAGLGQAEASSLTWGDVEWGTNGGIGKLSVRRRKTKNLFYPPIYPDLEPFLRRRHEGTSPPPDSTTRIFRIKDARKALTNACTRLGYPHFTQRSIRAYLIGRLWRKRVNLKLISKWQGHQDGGKLILSTYTEVFGDDDAEFAKQELSKL